MKNFRIQNTCKNIAGGFSLIANSTLQHNRKASSEMSGEAFFVSNYNLSKIGCSNTNTSDSDYIENKTKLVGALCASITEINDNIQSQNLGNDVICQPSPN